MDADTIVEGDIVTFMKERDTTKAVAGFVRTKVNIKSKPRKKLESFGIDLSPPLPTFNAGIMVFNLRLWRDTNAYDRLAEIACLNNVLELWTSFGSQPPLQMLFSGDRFEPLSDELCQHDMGKEDPRRRNTTNRIFLHWKGSYKPWLSTGRNTQYWTKYALQIPNQTNPSNWTMPSTTASYQVWDRERHHYYNHLSDEDAERCLKKPECQDC